MAIFTGIQHLCTFNKVAPTICHLLPKVWKASYTISMFIFVDVHTDCPVAWISLSLVLYQIPRSGSFTLAERSQSHGLTSEEYGGCYRISHYQRSKSNGVSWRMLGVNEVSSFSPESMRFRSLRQSERITAREPVQHNRCTYMCYRAMNTEHQ